MKGIISLVLLVFQLGFPTVSLHQMVRTSILAVMLCYLMSGVCYHNMFVLISVIRFRGASLIAYDYTLFIVLGVLSSQSGESLG